MTDREVQHWVLHQLDQEPVVHPWKIGVTVDEGVVTLSGHVDSEEERRIAERTTRQVYGVRGVTNALDAKQRAI